MNLDFKISKVKFLALSVRKCYSISSVGVGGNLVAVQASRITTSLHMTGSKPGKLPSGALNGCPNPGGAFCGTSKMTYNIYW